MVPLSMLQTVSLPWIFYERIRSSTIRKQQEDNICSRSKLGDNRVKAPACLQSHKKQYSKKLTCTLK
jgi:hypothetical protein